MKEAEKILAIDWGTQRIGVAIAILEANTILPLSALKSIKDLKNLIALEDPDLLVVGHPITMAGEESNNYEFNNFVEALKKQITIPIELFDERLSSKQADILLGGIDKSRRDSVAAMVILESYLKKHGQKY
ncbi:MAG: Holliday junction resolvase RuvX [Candidatus Pacebacteria bacterium]|nr:Holliday junction resolvase RuvX [Candidatus Paceibacterota bacterium]